MSKSQLFLTDGKHDVDLCCDQPGMAGRISGHVLVVVGNKIFTVREKGQKGVRFSTLGVTIP